uniref:60S ribosomal protein L7-3 n=2 Tax=Cajanus cajan TaxID=3821 RepID=A0A151R1W9_CAJCA|nr:60S ribosomal protein L7-3 [Cajanus cajan]
MDPRAKLLFTIRIDGIYAMHPKIRKILLLLRLRQIFNGVFLKANKATVNMHCRAEPYVTYGYPNLKSVQFTKKRNAMKRNRVGLCSKTHPFILGLKQKFPPSFSKELEDQSRHPSSEYYLLKHFPALTVTLPHDQTVEAFSPTRNQAIHLNHPS